MLMARTFLLAGSLSAFVAVVLGAFAAHMLKEKLSAEYFSIWEVGVRYHMYHALAMFVVAWTVTQFPESGTAIVGWLFLAGTILFSGSLYLLSLTGIRWLGAITPIGGLCFLLGWALLAWKVWRAL